MAKHLNTRAAAAKLAWRVIDQGQSIDAALAQHFEEHDLSPQDRGFIQELVYGVCRWYGELDTIASTLLKSPIRKKDRVVHFVLLVGLYQLHHLDTAEHAGVAETVSACKQLNKVWAKNLINGCLRTFLRNPSAHQPTENDDALTHPEWMAKQIKQDWPEHAQAIFKANNQRPPMCLRVNRRQTTRDEYLAELSALSIAAHADPHSSDGILLETPVSVSVLPGFSDGRCSVQDTAAQLACDFLTAEPSMSVLDACAAPGGKTAHLLERANNQLELHALDISERRCEQLYGTLGRLELQAQVFIADASQQPPSWPAPRHGYDRILIDAPCSGIGVIRRHPDIKHHRRASDITTLNQTQTALLDSLWELLKPGGQLLYMTCSILKQENQTQAQRFFEAHNDAKLELLNHPNALTLKIGVQTLPGVHEMDGFYYCLFRKQA